jgi:hypothetical protein
LGSIDSFDNTGKQYNLSRIINADSSLNIEAYKAYSPLFLPMAFVFTYGLAFASVPATLTHAFLYYRKQISINARRSLSEQPDIHSRLMSMYKEVPTWWYLTIFGLYSSSYFKVIEYSRILILFAVSMFALGVIVIEKWNTQLPVWAFVLVLLISTFLYD